MILLYFLIALLEIIGEYMELRPLIFATKPLLMIVLGFWFYQQTISVKNNKYRKWLLFSLFFAFGGDTFLMFLPYNENFFLLGLGSFLVGQICYAVAFIYSIKHSDGEANKLIRVLFILLFIGFYAGLMAALFDHLGEFLVPVLVYGMAICLMGLTAAWRQGKVSKDSFQLVLIGAITFVVSDTIIAINQFLYKGEFWNAQILIMITYVVAQYLIAKGSVGYLQEVKTAGNQGDS